MRKFNFYKSKFIGFLLVLTLNSFCIEVYSQQIPFNLSNLKFNGFVLPEQGTSIKFGPDGRLYLAQLNGQIKIYNIEKTGPNAYQVTGAEVILDVQSIPNFDDTGAPAWDGRSNRQVTGIVVKGNANNPVIYVSSSDPKWGGPVSQGGDRALDTNSGTITQLTKTPNGWEAIDVVRGLPRSEENHSTNGMEYVNIQGKPYLLVTSGGSTNAGSPSRNFAWTTEYALAAAVLSIDLQALEALPIKIDSYSGRKYIYDIPTLDDPSRPNVNGVYDPNESGYDGVDLGDPFGGNDGLNMAMLVPDGPVQIFSGGYRNTYDLVVTENDRVYLTDNGPNPTWGGLPFGEGNANLVNNNYLIGEPGATEVTAVITNGFPQYVTNQDQLLKVTDNIQSYTFGSFYGGHPTPIRANPGTKYALGSVFPFQTGGAGLFTRSLGDDSGFQNITPLYPPNEVFRTQILEPIAPGQPGFETFAANSLPVNWPPVHPSLANPQEADYIAPDLFNPNGPQPEIVTTLKRNSNAIAEYKSDAFQGALKGTLIIGRANYLHLVHLKPDGSLKFKEEDKFNVGGGNSLGIYSMSDEEAFPGTIWVASFNSFVRILTPADASFCPAPDDFYFDPIADYDGDGFSNQDEIDNGTDYCSGGSRPEDFDGDFLSDLLDKDDDNDGLDDAIDPLQLGSASSLPVDNELFSDKSDPLGRPFGYRGLGLTGLMNNGNNELSWLEWLDSVGTGPMPDDIYGGAAGAIQMAMTDGSANGNLNSQKKGFQFGVKSGLQSGPIWIKSNILGLTGPQLFYDVSHQGEVGIQMGDGSQSNFLKLVFTQSNLTASLELNDQIDSTPLSISIPENQRSLQGENILFMILVDPISGKVFPKVKIGERDTIHLGEKTLSGSVLEAVQNPNKDLIIGVYGSSGVSGVEFLTAYDFFKVVGSQPFTLQTLPSIQRQAGSIPKEIPLSLFFGDDEGESSLTYTVIVNGDLNLGATIIDRILRLEFPFNPGLATVRVRATDLKGYWVEQEFNVVLLEPESILYRINAGGEAVAGLNQAPNWQGNKINGPSTGFGFSVNSGVSQNSNFNWNERHESLPDYIDEVTFNGIFEEYKESGEDLVYTIPISPGTYKIRLYWGISSQSEESVGDRILQVLANGETKIPSLDIIAQFGKGSAGVSEFEVNSQGLLEIRIESLNGKSFVHGIEIIGKQISPPITITQSVPNQKSFVGEILDGTLFIKAEGGFGSIQFFAENLPPGIEIESVNGRLFGTVAPEALPNSPYLVILKIRDSNTPYANEEEVRFEWEIVESPNPLIGFWKMEDGTGTILTDSSGMGNDATLQSTANVSWTDGKEGLSIQLNGWSNRFATVPHQASLELPNELTIAAWIKPHILHKGTIMSKADGNGFELWLDTNGQIEFRLNRGNNGADYRLVSDYYYTSDLGKWVHVAATFNGQQSKIFINGVENSSSAYAPFGIGTTSGNLIIGALGTIQRFNGSLDEIRLYNKALDSQEIYTLVNGSLPIPNAPILIGPELGNSSLITLEVPLHWDPSSFADGYQLQIAAIADFSTLILNQDVGNLLSFIPERLVTDTNYFWRVRAYNSEGNSPWSEVWNFTKTAPLINPSDLVGFWKMEEGSGSMLVDYSDFANHAELQSTADVYWSLGRIDNALQLNGGGNRFAIVPHNSSLEIPNEITIAAWVNPNTMQRGTILNKTDGNGFEFWLDINGQLEFRLNRGNNGNTYRLRSNYLYTEDLGKWIHVAATFDGQQSKIYINGIEDISVSYDEPFSIETSTGNLILGALGTVQRFNGGLDEVRLYTKGLDNQEIYNLAKGSFPLPETPLLLGPENGHTSIATLEIPLLWDAALFAEGYQIQISTQADFNSLIVNQDLGESFSYLPEGLNSETNYFWRIRAYNNEGNSPWSEVWSFSKTQPILTSIDLVGFWKMEEGSGELLIDYSNNGNHAVLQNAANVSWSEGVIGQALQLNGFGNRFAIVPHNPSLVIPNGLTIAAWINPSTLQRGTILSKADGNGFEFWLDINGQLEFRLNRGNNGNTYTMRSNYNYSNDLGKWIHVTATFNGTESKIYINGEENASNVYSPFLIGTSSGNLIIGALGTIQRFNGGLDEVKLYNRALDGGEIQALTSIPSLLRTLPDDQQKGNNSKSPNTEEQALSNRQSEIPTQIKMYPNPTKGEVHLSPLWIEEGLLEVRLVDLQGKLHFQNNLPVHKRELVIDMNSNGLPPGTYIITIQDSKQLVQFKLVKE